MDLHAWITQQVDEVEKRARDCDATDWRHVGPGIIVDRDTDGWQHAPDNARIVTVTHERIWWSTNPAHSPEADHIVTHSPDAVLRRCEADRRILARHRLEPAAAGTDRAAACDGCGVEWVQDYCDPITDNLNDCPELLDLAHAHGLTGEILAGLDRPKPPDPKAQRDNRRLGLGDLLATPPITTSDVPAALRGPHWKP
ncbi:hypothetical protein SUDANB1_07180 [Streptomyces sp. enrichment culture]|uniref:DUF6221 family protein n=1 Tax=Streptomyces sp. enrichment culture TaxID=1795815 RepID=UPI003F556E5F